MRTKQEDGEHDGLFTPGDWVEWTSQSRRVKKTKKGQVCFWVEKGTMPSVTYGVTPIPAAFRAKYGLLGPKWIDAIDLFRWQCDPRSVNYMGDRYAVIVPNETGRGKHLLYMPYARNLRALEK